MPSLRQSLFDAAGGLVDDLFLAPPKLLLPFKPRRHIDLSAYEQQIDFYIDHGFTKSPETFFRLPGHAPAHRLIERKAYHQGEIQVWSFPSGYETGNPLLRDRYNAFANNRTGYLIRWTHGDSARKTVLCLHGFMLGEPRQAARMFKVNRLFERGLDVALFITPFHWRRAPENRMRRGIFLQPDNVPMTCECFGQAMHDLQSTLLILEDLGAGTIGLIGASLGGYNAALFTCLSDRPAFTAMMVPAVNFSAPFGPESVKLPFPVSPALGEKIRQVWEFHSPVNMRPRLPPEKIMVIASRGDKLCPFEHTRRLCEEWNLANCHFLTGGHWLIFNNQTRGREWYRFLEQNGFFR
jgi:predicted alpha/beta hydrolase family esterase